MSRTNSSKAPPYNTAEFKAGFNLLTRSTRSRIKMDSSLDLARQLSLNKIRKRFWFLWRCKSSYIAAFAPWATVFLIGALILRRNATARLPSFPCKKLLQSWNRSGTLWRNKHKTNWCTETQIRAPRLRRQRATQSQTLSACYTKRTRTPIKWAVTLTSSESSTLTNTPHQATVSSLQKRKRRSQDEVWPNRTCQHHFFRPQPRNAVAQTKKAFAEPARRPNAPVSRHWSGELIGNTYR
jgi:hypothetical protein